VIELVGDYYLVCWELAEKPHGNTEFRPKIGAENCVFGGAR